MTAWIWRRRRDLGVWRPVPVRIRRLYLPLASPSTSSPSPAARRRRGSSGGGVTSAWIRRRRRDLAWIRQRRRIPAWIWQRRDDNIDLTAAARPHADPAPTMTDDG
uniref:Uncharacterized protein n=1 Tax=Oryza sativa subsp. japonica TaxID=39947 RepID=Q6ZC38_ORYSJ|nr:hypothetical protein [Oryza sativa Japonica Group]